MRFASLSVAVLGACLLFGNTARADEAGAPAESEKPAKKAPQLKVVKPWSLITTLTEEQKQKIVAIREAIAAERKKLEAMEKEQILAVLTDAQKQELADAEAAESASKKAADAAKKAEEAARRAEESKKKAAGE